MLLYVLIFIVITAISAFLAPAFLPRFGQNPKGERLEKIKKSPNYKNGKFQNLNLTPQLAEEAGFFSMFRDFFFASWIGMLPGTVMYVYIGSLAGDLATLGAGGRTRSLTEWVLYGVGLLATLIVTIFVTKIARNALKKKVEEG